MPKKTFEAAAQVQTRLIVQLKDNQPSLLQKVETACASQRPVSSDTSVCTGRNRHETRSADVFSATRSVAGTEWKSLVQSIVRVTREVLHRDAKTGLWSSTSEVAYYVANSAVSACLAATAIRHHWNVENTLHYTRETSLSRKINPASVVTRVSSHGCAASPTMCYAVTEPAPSVRTDTPPLSLDSMPWPTGASVESIEQPWGHYETTSK